MPIYEYVCDTCQKISEWMLKLSDPAPQVCPHCNTTHHLKKVMSKTNFQLQGGGWYKDAYSSTSKANTTSTPSTEAATPDKPAVSTPAPSTDGKD